MVFVSSAPPMRGKERPLRRTGPEGVVGNPAHSLCNRLPASGDHRSAPRRAQPQYDRHPQIPDLAPPRSVSFRPQYHPGPRHPHRHHLQRLRPPHRDPPRRRHDQPPAWFRLDADAIRLSGAGVGTPAVGGRRRRRCGRRDPRRCGAGRGLRSERGDSDHGAVLHLPGVPRSVIARVVLAQGGCRGSFLRLLNEVA